MNKCKNFAGELEVIVMDVFGKYINVAKSKGIHLGLALIHSGLALICFVLAFIH